MVIHTASVLAVNFFFLVDIVRIII